MNTNNPSDKDRTQNLDEEDNESTNESRNLNDAQNTDKNRMQGSSQSSAAGNTGAYRSKRGTGMSSEAGSSQSERSWQDTTGGQPEISQGNSNFSNDTGEVNDGLGTVKSGSQKDEETED
jgi:hypothetical protein